MHVIFASIYILTKPYEWQLPPTKRLVVTVKPCICVHWKPSPFTESEGASIARDEDEKLPRVSLGEKGQGFLCNVTRSNLSNIPDFPLRGLIRCIFERRIFSRVLGKFCTTESKAVFQIIYYGCGLLDYISLLYSIKCWNVWLGVKPKN